ncbi:MAG: hypothetical protein J7K49_04385 [Thaumarchaeota archaeon]|nr:hypothetical protein [Nitrososphaerota archaeon]
MTGEGGRINQILLDLIRKYETLSKRFDESSGEMSLTQLTKHVDALTRLAKLILSYRGLLEFEERERELTRILSEVRKEIESNKHSLKTVKTYGITSFASVEDLARKLLEEIKRIKFTFMGGEGIE